MKSKLLEVLQSPDTKAELIFEASSRSLVDTEKKHSYNIIENVPVLLAEDAREAEMKADQHVKENTSFRYVDHYQLDAEEFNYFEEYEDGPTIHSTRRLHEVIISEIPAHTQNVLDVGCGNAWVAKNLCPKGIDVYSLDISTVNPIKALKKHPFENHYALVGDVYALPVQENSFDCIIASEIIEHVPDPKTFIDNLIAVLKPGGKLIVTTPYNEKLNYSLCIHCNRPTPQHAHIHSFTEQKILSLVDPDRAREKKAYAFANKALIKLRTHVFLGVLPFRLWKIIDQLSNSIVNKPSRLLLKVTKKPVE